MGSFILRGITRALLVTVLTLIAGIAWNVMNLGGLSISQFLDIGLVASCLFGGYLVAKESGEWWLGGVVGAGYVTVGTLLLAIFLPIREWGFIQVLAEGAVIGLVGGAVVARGTKGPARSAWSRKTSHITPSYEDYETNVGVSSKFDWDIEEESTEWQEAPIIKRAENCEKSPDVQWPWNSEIEEAKEWQEAPITKRVENCEKNSEVQWPWNSEAEKSKEWQEAPIIKRVENCEKSPAIKWPWNREKEKFIDSGPRRAEPLRIGTSMNKSSGEKPWWE